MIFVSCTKPIYIDLQPFNRTSSRLLQLYFQLVYIYICIYTYHLYLYIYIICIFHISLFHAWYTYIPYTLLVPPLIGTVQQKTGISPTLLSLDLRQDALIWNLRAGGWPFSLVIQVPEEPGGKCERLSGFFRWSKRRGEAFFCQIYTYIIGDVIFKKTIYVYLLYILTINYIWVMWCWDVIWVILVYTYI